MEEDAPWKLGTIVGYCILVIKNLLTGSRRRRLMKR